MAKSTITITDEGGQIKFYAQHDPPTSGPKSNWSIPAFCATKMMEDFLIEARDNGILPSVVASKDSMTGHIDVVTSKNVFNKETEGKTNDVEGSDSTGPNRIG